MGKRGNKHFYEFGSYRVDPEQRILLPRKPACPTSAEGV